MAFERLLQRIQQIRHDIIANREAEVLRISLDQIALTKLRIQTRGDDYSGAQFAPYVPAYAKNRKKAGYQVGYVDFTRTGRMWANVHPVIVSSSVFSATVELQGSDQRSKDIIAGARPKRGDILRPSAGEIELTRRANRTRLQRYFDQLGL
jgi:hypothetical protein